MILQWQCSLPIIYRPPHFPLHASISFFSLKDFSPLFHHRRDILEDVGIFAVIRFALTKWSTEWTADLQFISAECCACPLFQPFCKRARVKKSTKGKGENGGRGGEKGKIERNGEEEEEEGNNIAHRGII